MTGKEIRKKIAAALLSACIFSVCGLTKNSIAAPAISGASGNISHGETVTVTGTDFGTKNPAPPLIWDDGENKTLNNASAITAEGGWDESWPNGTTHHVRTQWQNQYRASGFRGVTTPHSHSSSYLVGGHWNDYTDEGRNVAVTAAADDYKNNWYASWYVRLDPSWPQADGEVTTLVPNYKDYVFQPGTASYTGNHIIGDPGQNAFNYDACTSCITNRNLNITPASQTICGNLTSCDQEYCRNQSTRYWVNASPSEVFDWKRNEVLLQETPGLLKRNHYTGTARTEAIDVACPGGVNLVNWGIRSFTIGGFMKNSDAPGNAPYDYPNWSAIRDISDHWHDWIRRGASDEYYVVFDGSEIGDTEDDPWIGVEPDVVRLGGVDKTSADKGVVGSLAPGQWNYGDFDSLGYNTVYIRLPEGVSNRNPGSNGPGYVLLTARSGEANGRLHPDAFRYFDDMYIDTTFSRAVLANNPDLDQATIVEPQIPSAWNDNSILVTANLGKLPDLGTAYLFVFDSNNYHNQTGYPVSLGGLGDSTAPTAPTGLAVR